LPIGTDARVYIYQLETVTLGASKAGAWRLINLLPTILTFSIFFPFRLTGISWDFIIKFVPLAFGVFYLFFTYYFIKKCTNNNSLALVSSIFTAVSLQTLVLSTVLFKNFLSVSLFLLFLTLYFIYFVNTDGRKYLLYLCSALLLLICAQDAYTAIFLTMTLVLFIFVNLGCNINDGLHLLKNTLKMYIPVPIVILLFDSYNFYLYGRLEQPITAFLPSIIKSNFSIASLSPVVWITTFQNNWQHIFLENAYLLFFAFIGIVGLLFSIKTVGKRQFYFTSLLFSWIMCISLMMCITNLNESYRFVLYFPFPILAAIGLLYVVKLLTSYVKAHSFNLSRNLGFHSKKLWSSIRYLSFLLLCLVLLNGTLARINSSSYFLPYSLPSEELEALEWIKDEYSSQQTIFIMNPPGWSNTESEPHYWQWAAYFFLPDISNISIYVGTLSSLFSENLSQQLSSMTERPSYSKDVLNEYSILLINSHNIGTFYYSNIVEESLLVEVHPYVYAVKNISVPEIESWITTWATFVNTGRIVPNDVVFEDSSFNSWAPHHGFLVNNGNATDLNLAEGYTDMWIDIANLSIDSSQYPFLELEVDPHGDTIALDFYGSDGNVLGRYWKFPSWTGSRIFYLKLNDFISEGNISRIALIYMSKNTTSNCSFYSLKIFNL
jgi:hypothetical protein